MCGLVSTLQNSHALRSARIMQRKGRLNDEISQTGEKLRIIVVKIDELLLFRLSGLVSTLENVCTTFGTHDAVKVAFKGRNILSGREITYSYRQNRRIIAICVCLGLYRQCKTRALRSACSERCVETSKYLKRERNNA